MLGEWRRPSAEGLACITRFDLFRLEAYVPEVVQMLSKLEVKGFRSIEDAVVDFGPLTLLYGPTASGKSSLLYSLMVLRNFVLNPNQTVDGFFSLGFLALGPFEEVVFNHQPGGGISITGYFDKEPQSGNYGVRLMKSEADIFSASAIQDGAIRQQTRVALPYAGGTSWNTEYSSGEGQFTVNWNGFASSVVPTIATSESQARAIEIAEALNYPAEALKAVDICPNRRGFFKPSYSPTQVSPTPTSEEEVATLIINDPNSAPRISNSTLEIFDRDFRLFSPSGTATHFLQTTEQVRARVPGYLVNDGFGVNQVVYMLAKIHRPAARVILIEEPEVHLHPTVISKFAREVTRIAVEEKKQLVFTTHSADFVLAILGCVAEGVIEPDSLRCYYVEQERKRTVFNRQEVTKGGQVSGGLASFMEGQLEDIRKFLSHEK